MGNMTPDRKVFICSFKSTLFKKTFFFIDVYSFGMVLYEIFVGKITFANFFKLKNWL